MKRFFCLCLYLPFHWLATFFVWIADWAFIPLYRENGRLYELRKKQARADQG